MKIAAALFAKTPEVGRVKTRLVPALGAAGACALYRAMVQDTLDKLARGPFEVELWYAGAPWAEPSLPSFPQRGRDLGERMAAAFEAMLARADAALIVGADAPTLPLRCLHAAAAHLARGDSVVGPAADGGYYLIGSGEVPCFEGVRWSTRHALRDTLRTVAARRLEPWYDVDRPADLTLLRAHLELSPRAAPRTAEALATAGRAPRAHRVRVGGAPMTHR